MDRLQALIVALALTSAGCEEEITPEPGAARQRSVGVSARADDPAVRFCDTAAPIGQGRAIELPPLEGPSLPGDGWRWINVWATWCPPCIEEMPRIAEWRTRMAAEGGAFTPYFVSVDSTAEEVTTYRAAHPGTPESARVTEGGLGALAASLGLDAATTIPIHALVDPTGHVRCVRSGSVSDRDYETLISIFRGR